MLYYIMLIFIVYGLLSPIYFRIFRGKLSNEKYFSVTWLTAPYLVSYFYCNVFLIFLLAILNILGYVLIVTNKSKHLYDGLLFFISAVIIVLFYKL